MKMNLHANLKWVTLLKRANKKYQKNNDADRFRECATCIGEYDIEQNAYLFICTLDDKQWFVDYIEDNS